MCRVIDCEAQFTSSNYYFINQGRSPSARRQAQDHHPCQLEERRRCHCPPRCLQWRGEEIVPWFYYPQGTVSALIAAALTNATIAALPKDHASPGVKLKGRLGSEDAILSRALLVLRRCSVGSPFFVKVYSSGQMFMKYSWVAHNA